MANKYSKNLYTKDQVRRVLEGAGIDIERIRNRFYNFLSISQ